MTCRQIYRPQRVSQPWGSSPSLIARPLLMILALTGAALGAAGCGASLTEGPVASTLDQPGGKLVRFLRGFDAAPLDFVG